MSFINFFFSGICHQIPAHCFYYGGHPLPLCARCMGTFSGALVALLTLWAMGQGRRSRLPSWQVGGLLIAATGFWALDGANSLARSFWGWHGLYTPSNTLRLFTGIGSGLALGVVLYPIYHFAMWGGTDGRRVLDRGWQIGVLLLAEVALAGIILAWRSAPFFLWLVILVGAVVTVFSTVNAALIVLLRKKEGFAGCWMQIVPYLVIGLVCGLVETGLMAVLRRMSMG